MNILIPHHWLLEHLETKATPEQIQKYLSLCGPSVERINNVNGEPVYDIEVTTNRVDCMSVRGIAREATAILPEFGVKAFLKPLKLPNVPETISGLDLNIINDNSLHNRILAIKIGNTTLSPSPKWVQDRLEQVGQRPLNNAVDITNYVMWELGNPMHVFDYDRLTHKTIIVREAKKGEKVITLDGKTHILRGGEIVYDDGTGTIIDVPGIMGTQNTVVTGNTKNILLWTENSAADKIRFASMAHGIRTQAAILNEKNLDPKLAHEAMLHSIELMQQLTVGNIASQLVDIYPAKTALQPIEVSQEIINTYLGVNIQPKRITRILENLGCSTSYKLQATSYTVTPPSWRTADLQIPQDIIEEVARIYGYHNLPSVLMPTPIPNNPPNENFHLEHAIKQWLADWGLTEVYTFSLVSKALAEQSGYSLQEHLRLKNSLTDEWVYLRRSLIPSHFEVISQNKSQNQISIFEMSNVYIPSAKHSTSLPTEELHLTITTTSSYRHLKGILDALSAKLHLREYEITPGKKIICDSTTLGEVHHLNSHIFTADILVTPLITQASLHPLYVPVIDHPPIIEDLTFTIPHKTPIGPIISASQSVSPLIESVNLKDIYEQNHTFTITYRHPDKSLTDQEVAPIRKLIVTTLEKTFSAKLVGKI